MAMMNCPECGKEISDKAINCPKCGYPLNPQNKIEKQPAVRKKAKVLGIIIFIIAFMIIAMMGIIMLYNQGVFKKKLSISNISLGKWKLTSEGRYYDEYDGIVTSDEKNPFVAVIGYYEDSEREPQFVFMENGQGVFHTVEPSDDDPSLKYTAIGYIDGIAIDVSDVKEIKYNTRDYKDWEHDTSCYVDISITVKDQQSGLMFLEMTNDLTKEVVRNINIPIVDGMGEYEASSVCVRNI